MKIKTKPQPGPVISCSQCGKFFYGPSMLKNVRGTIRMPCPKCSKKRKKEQFFDEPWYKSERSGGMLRRIK